MRFEFTMSYICDLCKKNNNTMRLVCCLTSQLIDVLDLHVKLKMHDLLVCSVKHQMSFGVFQSDKTMLIYDYHHN